MAEHVGITQENIIYLSESETSRNHIVAHFTNQFVHSVRIN